MCIRDSRKAAEKIATKIRAEAHSEILLGRKKPSTVEAALTRFVESKAGTPNHRNLVSNKNTVLRIINGSMPLNAIGPSVLEEYKRIRMAEGCLPQTIKHGLNCIVGAMRLARKQGYDCPDIQAPSIKITNKMVRYLSVDEERRLLDQLDPEREVNGLPPLASRLPDRHRWIQDSYDLVIMLLDTCLLYTSPSPRDRS